MRSRLFLVLGLGTVLSISLATSAYAQEKPKAGFTKEGRIVGAVHSVSKDTSTITVRRENTQRQVIYDASTQFTFKKQPSTADEVKEGRRVICLGRLNDKNQLMARAIDIQPGAAEGR